jgi:hypothetical protein
MKQGYNLVSKEDVLWAIAELKMGKKSRWGPAKKFLLVCGEDRFAPKAVLGLAIAHHFRIDQWDVREFNGGEPTNAILRELGFDIELKHR